MNGFSELDVFSLPALDDFAKTNNPDTQLDNAEEFGIQIIETNMKSSDWRIVEGSSKRFHHFRGGSPLPYGHNDKDDYYIRKVEAIMNSNIRLYYYGLTNGDKAIIEINRRPGLHIVFCSGRKSENNGVYCVVDCLCTQERKLLFKERFKKLEQKHYVP